MKTFIFFIQTNERGKHCPIKKAEETGYEDRLLL